MYFFCSFGTFYYIYTCNVPFMHFLYNFLLLLLLLNTLHYLGPFSAWFFKFLGLDNCNFCHSGCNFPSICSLSSSDAAAAGDLHEKITGITSQLPIVAGTQYSLANLPCEFRLIYSGLTRRQPGAGGSGELAWDTSN